MQFEWDEAKNIQNMRKHGLSFEMVNLVFNSFHLTTIDSRKDYGETRMITLGTLGEFGRTVVVAHTKRREVTRIISMRKANAREISILQIAYGVEHAEI